jgi:hypothetical protein
MTSMAITGEVVDAGLVRGGEQMWVRETPTGLAFDPETPIEVWGGLVERLQRQQKVIEWALADAINFGEAAYGEMYAQWVDETGLSKRTLQNIARIGRIIEPARRRADVSFSHHAEVASLPVPEQESLLDRAEQAGMTRYELRDAVRERKEQLRGRAIDVDGEPVCTAEAPWRPQLSDLAPDVRASLEAQAPPGRHRTGFIAGAIWALVWNGAEDAFLEWKGQ